MGACTSSTTSCFLAFLGFFSHVYTGDCISILLTASNISLQARSISSLVTSFCVITSSSVLTLSITCQFFFSYSLRISLASSMYALKLSIHFDDNESKVENTVSAINVAREYLLNDLNTQSLSSYVIGVSFNTTSD
jgi:hypothetical protein